MIPFLIIGANRLGLISAEILYNISYAQLITGIFSSIYFLRFPDLNEIKIGTEALVICAVSIFIIKHSSASEINIFLITTTTILLTTKDYVRLLIDQNLNFISVRNVIGLISLIIILYYLLNFDGILGAIFIPLLLIFPFAKCTPISLVKTFDSKKIRFLVEDLFVHLNTFLLATWSFNQLKLTEYENLRFLLVLCSLSGVLQYFLFQYIFYKGKQADILRILEKVKYPMYVTCLIFFFLSELLFTVVISIISGIYYFSLKSIWKYNLLSLINIIPSATFGLKIIFWPKSSLELSDFYFLIILSALTPIAFYEIKSKTYFGN